MGNPDTTTEESALLDEFAMLTTILQKRQQQVVELGAQRRKVAQQLREGDVTVEQIAKRAGIGTQAVYKLLSAG